MSQATSVASLRPLVNKTEMPGHLFRNRQAAVASASTNEIMALPDMSAAKIAAGKAAENAVIRKLVADPNDGLSSTHGPTTQLAFMLGFDVAGFAKRGDRVWQVHFVALDGHTARIAWVNAETGTVMFLMEEMKSTPNKAADATTESAPVRRDLREIKNISN